MKHWNLDISGYWVIGTGFCIEKDLELSPVLQGFLKIIALAYINELAKFGDCGSEDKFQKRTLPHELILIMTSQIW